MRVFFGKIASKMNPAQFHGGYYETDNPAWFNGVDVGDYVFAISGSNIELWKARSWREDKLRLDFDKVLLHLDGKTAKLMAFKYFNLSPLLISATTKSLRNTAFVPINLAKPITEAQLTNPDLYKDTNNFRRIKVLQKASDCDPASEDVQLYQEDGKWNIFLAPFMEGDTFRNFKDNTDKIGGGRKKKDKTLSVFKNLKTLPREFHYNELNIRNIYEAFAVPYEGKEEVEEDEEETEEIISGNEEVNPKLMAQPLNQILYGPPGTGKTYNTLVRALSIIEEADQKTLELTDRDKLRKRYNEYVERGQIAFVTFHQSFAYEDFIEGIKPKMPEDSQDNVSNHLEYEIMPGIFKRMCEEAKGLLNTQSESSKGLLQVNEEELEKANFFKMSLGDSQDPRDQQIYDYCLQHDCVAMGWGRDVDFSDAESESEIKEIYLNAGKEIQAYDYGVFAMKCLKFFMKEGDLILIPRGNFTIRAIAKVTGDYFFDPESPIGYNQFRRVKWVAKDIDLPIQQVYSKRFSMQTIYELYTKEIKLDFLKSLIKKEPNKKQNYVLIIDEINRGNVSQIFGELITLIEEDKRLGKKEELKVKLPYSKDEPFGVPPNLYIIGTMNTADRSVEALDTALRRRFSFEHMPPKPELFTPNVMLWNLLEQYAELEWDEAEYRQKEEQVLQFLGAEELVKTKMRGFWDVFVESDYKKKEDFSGMRFSGITLSQILSTINARIEKLLDSDHQIGHSYFMGVATLDDLLSVFYRSIIPLLQEYFFGDYGKIGLVLGGGFVQTKPGNSDKNLFADFKDYENAGDFNDRVVYEIVDYRKNDLDFELKVDQKSIRMDFEKAIKLMLKVPIE